MVKNHLSLETIIVKGCAFMRKSKITSVMCAVMFLCGMVTACSEKNGGQSSVSESETVVFRTADIEMAGDFSEIISLDRNDSGSVYIFGQLVTGGYSGYTTDSSFSEYSSFSFVPQTDEYVKSSAFLPYGKKAVLTYLDGETIIYIYSADGKQEKVLNCGEVLGDAEAYAEIFPCGKDGYIINISNTSIAYISADGKYKGNVNTAGMAVLGVAGGENTVECLLMDKEDSYVAGIDGENLSLTDKRKCSGINSTALASCCGTGDYNYTGLFDKGIYGLKDGTFQKISGFTDMLFQPYDVRQIIQTDDGYAVSLWDNKMYYLSETEISDLKAKKVVKMAWFGDEQPYSDAGMLMKKYNSDNIDGEYKIEFKFYPDIFGENADGVETLQLDMISGNAPDIIPFNSYMPIDSFGANDEIFADMYPFIDKDPDLNREDFLPNILDGLERNGKLVQIVPYFIFSSVPARASCGIPENWSVDDMVEAYNNLPEGVSLFSDEYTKGQPKQIFLDILDLNSFVDYENAECNFNSPDFINFIKFFKENNIGLSWTEYGNISEQFWNFTSQDIYDGKVAVDLSSGFMNFGMIHSTVKGEFQDDIVFAGYAGDGVNNGSLLGLGTTYGIMADSPNVEGAWDFLRMFVSDYYYEEVNTYSFPVIKERFDEECEKYTRDCVVVDETGKTVTGKWTYQPDASSDYRIDIENFTQEECEYYKNMVLSARTARYDNTVLSIVREEANKYFEDECTAEQSAEMIQSRVSIYLSETYN